MMTPSDDAEQLRAEAMHPTTRPDRLRELAGDHSLEPFLAQNPNTPPDLLCQLAASYPQQFLANPVLPLLFLENPRFSGMLSDEALQAPLRYETAPGFLLAACPQVFAEEVYTTGNPECPV
jgi:hypothetical protein